MGTPAKANVLFGNGIFYTHTAGTSNPVASNAVDWTGWTRFGFQKGGGSIRYVPDIFPVEVDEEPAPIDRVILMEQVSVLLVLAESDLAQLQYAIAGATYTAGATPGTNENVLDIGGKSPDSSMPSLALGIQANGMAGSGNPFVGWFPYMNPIGQVELPFQKGEIRTVGYEFEAQSDPSASAGEKIGKLIEITTA